MKLAAIFATDSDGGMGYQNHMPWPPLSADFRRFKKLTTGSVIVMGSRTWLSADMPNPLPNRHSVVWTHQPILARATDQVLLVSGDPARCWTKIQQQFQAQTAWVIGGAQTLRHWMPLCEEVHWTHVRGSWPCDTAYDLTEWQPDFELVYSENCQEQTINLEFTHWRRR